MIRRFSFLLTACVLVFSFSGTASAEESALRTVSVNGIGEIETLPDAAWITMGIEARHKKLDAAQLEVDQRVAQFLKLTDSLAIDRKYVKTTGKNVRPEYRWDDKTRKQYLIGYFVSRQLQVDLRNLDQLGALLHRAVDAGVNQVSPPQMRALNERALQRKALGRAAEDARANAAVLASSLGAKLGDVQQINANNRVHQPQPQYRMAAMSMDAAKEMAPEQSYESGQIKFTTTVTVTFELK